MLERHTCKQGFFEGADSMLSYDLKLLTLVSICEMWRQTLYTLLFKTHPEEWKVADCV